MERAQAHLFCRLADDLIPPVVAVGLVALRIPPACRATTAALPLYARCFVSPLVLRKSPSRPSCSKRSGQNGSGRGAGVWLEEGEAVGMYFWARSWGVAFCNDIEEHRYIRRRLDGSEIVASLPASHFKAVACPRAPSLPSHGLRVSAISRRLGFNRTRCPSPRPWVVQRLCRARKERRDRVGADVVPGRFISGRLARALSLGRRGRGLRSGRIRAQLDASVCRYGRLRVSDVDGYARR